jgi:hypothetical protein
MKLISRLRGRCFCAFCKAERKVYVKKHVDLTNVVAAVVLAMIVGQAYWGGPDPRALMLFCLTIVGSEMLIYLRWRSSVVCHLCGFDPVVYKRSPEDAARMVRAFYAEKQDNPDFWLTRSPLVERKRQVRGQERKAAGHKALHEQMLARRTRAAMPPTIAAPAKTSSLASAKSP